MRNAKIPLGIAVGVLLGLFIAGILLAFPEAWRSGTYVTKTILHTQNGRRSATWMLRTYSLVGIRVSASDPHYCMTVADQSAWMRREHYDTFEFTLGDRDGRFFHEYHARTETTTRSGSGTRGEHIKSITFRNIRRRGYAPAGTVLGTFTLKTEDGSVVTGEISVVNVTEELFFPIKHVDGDEEP